MGLGCKEYFWRLLVLLLARFSLLACFPLGNVGVFPRKAPVSSPGPVDSLQSAYFSKSVGGRLSFGVNRNHAFNATQQFPGSAVFVSDPKSLARTMQRSRCAKRTCSAGSGHTQNIPNSEASVLPDLTTKSAKKLMVEPPATVGWVSVQLLYMMSRTIFYSALELSALKTWSVRPMSE